jgi:uncharacterized membrane protein
MSVDCDILLVCDGCQCVTSIAFVTSWKWRSTHRVWSLNEHCTLLHCPVVATAVVLCHRFGLLLNHWLVG